MVPPPKAGVGQPRILSPLDGRVGAVCLAWYLCPCVQACVQGLELLLLVLALLSGLLGVGWEVQRAEQEQGWDSERAAGVEKYWAVPAVCRVPLATRVLLKWVPPHPRRGWGSSPASCNSARCCAPERGVLAANPGAGARYPLRAAKRGIEQVLPCSPTLKRVHQGRARTWGGGWLQFLPLFPAALFTQGGRFPSLGVMQRQPLT